MNLIGICFL